MAICVNKDSAILLILTSLLTRLRLKKALNHQELDSMAVVQLCIHGILSDMTLCVCSIARQYFLLDKSSQANPFHVNWQPCKVRLCCLRYSSGQRQEKIEGSCCVLDLCKINTNFFQLD